MINHNDQKACSCFVTGRNKRPQQNPFQTIFRINGIRLKMVNGTHRISLVVVITMQLGAAEKKKYVDVTTYGLLQYQID
jgi:hypothetical protein